MIQIIHFRSALHRSATCGSRRASSFFAKLVLRWRQAVHRDLYRQWAKSRWVLISAEFEIFPAFSPPFRAINKVAFHGGQP